MTVHKAKGLEFPVVILADLTAKLVGPQGADRTSNAEKRLCAQRLLWCAPWELLDAAEDEAKAEEVGQLFPTRTLRHGHGSRFTIKRLIRLQFLF